MEIKKHCKYKFSDQHNLIYRFSNEKTQSQSTAKKKKMDFSALFASILEM